MSSRAETQSRGEEPFSAALRENIKNFGILHLLPLDWQIQRV